METDELLTISSITEHCTSIKSYSDKIESFLNQGYKLIFSYDSSNSPYQNIAEDFYKKMINEGYLVVAVSCNQQTSLLSRQILN